MKKSSILIFALFSLFTKQDVWGQFFNPLSIGITNTATVPTSATLASALCLAKIISSSVRLSS